MGGTPPCLAQIEAASLKKEWRNCDEVKDESV
jgi:hypothetical protein